MHLPALFTLTQGDSSYRFVFSSKRPGEYVVNAVSFTAVHITVDGGEFFDTTLAAVTKVFRCIACFPVSLEEKGKDLFVTILDDWR